MHLPSELSEVYEPRRAFLVYSTIGDHIPLVDPSLLEIDADFWQLQPRLHGVLRRVEPALALFIKDIAWNMELNRKRFVLIDRADVNIQDLQFSFSNLNLDMGIDMELGMDPAYAYPVPPLELSSSTIIGIPYTLNAYVTD